MPDIASMRELRNRETVSQSNDREPYLLPTLWSPITQIDGSSGTASCSPRCCSLRTHCIISLAFSEATGTVGSFSSGVSACSVAEERECGDISAQISVKSAGSSGIEDTNRGMCPGPSELVAKLQKIPEWCRWSSVRRCRFSVVAVKDDMEEELEEHAVEKMDESDKYQAKPCQATKSVNSETLRTCEHIYQLRARPLGSSTHFQALPTLPRHTVEASCVEHSTSKSSQYVREAKMLQVNKRKLLHSGIFCMSLVETEMRRRKESRFWGSSMTFMVESCPGLDVHCTKSYPTNKNHVLGDERSLISDSGAALLDYDVVVEAHN